MPYYINHTNGTSLVTVADGTVDNTTTSINLVGKSFPTYGQLFNQNFVNLLEKYERVLYIDSDVMVTPSAKNIFEQYPDINKFYAYHENDYDPIMDRDYCINPLLGDCPNWPLGKNGKLQYFNAGVFLVSSPQKFAFNNYRNVPNLPSILNFGDQTYMNYIISKNNIIFESLDYSFNRMNLGKRDDSGERFNADFIHYAGIDTYGDGNKLKTIKSDYLKLYGT